MTEGSQDNVVGKGRGGGQPSGRAACFSTPPSKPLGSERDETGVRQSEGRMPEETEVQKTMGRLKTGDDAKFSDPESLQRALEIEVVSQLREQNARLMEELETYRLATHLVKENAGGVHFLENLFFQGFPIRRCYPLQF